MLNLFNKGPKVRTGKQNNEPKKPAAAASDKKRLKLGGLGAAFKKLNSMDRKQAYTWGAVAVVGIVALLMLASMAGSRAEDDFSGYETRGYDLANMPFSADEAEQYLLASKYPDLKDKNGGLYSKEEKAARQEADAQQEAKDQAKGSAASSKASQYVPGRYYGGGKAGSGPQTQVNKINSAQLKGASGSGISGAFGPKGDFSNFKSQNKGNDRFAPQTQGKMNARQALFQTAKGSRAAAGLKNDKLLNAKKAMLGGDIKGSDAFMNNSGAVDLSKASGLELDTNAPVNSADLDGLDDALDNANDDAANDAANDEETQWWQEMLQDLAKQLAQSLLTMGMNATQDAIAQAKQDRALESASYLNTMESVNNDWASYDSDMRTFNADPDAWKGSHPGLNAPIEPATPRPPAMDSTGISANDLARLQGNPAAAKKVGLEYKNGQWQNRSDHSVITLDANGGISGETLNGLGRKNLGSDLAKANGMLQQDYFQNNQIFQNNAKRDVANYHANNPANSQPLTQDDTRRKMCTTGTTTYTYAGRTYNC